MRVTMKNARRGPGVMRTVDQVAASLGIYRLGVGIDAEEIGGRETQCRLSRWGPAKV